MNSILREEGTVPHRSAKAPRSNRVTLVVIAVTTLAAIAICLYCLSSGVFIIFQNLLYIPIIIACVQYTKRGFIFSIILALTYLALIFAFTRDPIVIVQASVSVLIFVAVAGITAFLSIKLKRAEDALQQSGLRDLDEAQRRYKELFDNIAVALLRTTPGPQGTFIDVNPAAVALFEADDRAQLLALHPSDIYWDADQRRIVSDTIVAKGFLKGEDIHFKTLKGNSFWGRVTVTKVSAARGQIYFDATIEDITARKKAEAEIRESEAKFRTLFDNANDGMLLADMDNKKFHFGNATICRMLGYSQEELKNLGVMDIHPEKDVPFVVEQFEKQFRKEISLAKDLPVKRKDGSVFYADVSSNPITMGGTSYLLGIFRDITERKKAEEGLMSKMRQLEMLCDATIGREERVIEVKKEVNELLRELGRKPKYHE